MAATLETDQRNTQFANRIERIVRSMHTASDEDIFNAVGVLNSLISPEAAELEYQARRRQLPGRIHLNLANLNPILDIAYHPAEVRNWQSVFQNLPEGLEFPVFAIKILETIQPTLEAHVPTHYGMMPNIALTPDGYLVRFRPTYYFTREGKGLMYTDLWFTNPHDLQPIPPYKESSHKEHLRRAQAISINPALNTIGPRSIIEEDFAFLELVMTHLENPIT